LHAFCAAKLWIFLEFSKLFVSLLYYRRSFSGFVISRVQENTDRLTPLFQRNVTNSKKNVKYFVILLVVPIFFFIFALKKQTYSLLTNKTWEDKTMKTQKMYNEEEFELDNQYNEEERYIAQSNSSNWYN